MAEQRVTWRKSSYSGGSGGGCVEVADLGELMLIRDSKDLEGGVLAVTPDQWRAFLHAVAR